MRPVRKTYTTTGAKEWIPMDVAQNVFNASVAVTLGSTGTFGVEVTYDDIFDSTITPVAFPLIAAGTITNAAAALNAPVRAVRLNIAAVGSNIVMNVLQGLDGA